jgi:hypothetical protein
MTFNKIQKLISNKTKIEEILIILMEHTNTSTHDRVETKLESIKLL